MPNKSTASRYLLALVAPLAALLALLTNFTPDVQAVRVSQRPRLGARSVGSAALLQRDVTR